MSEQEKCPECGSAAVWTTSQVTTCLKCKAAFDTDETDSLRRQLAQAKAERDEARAALEAVAAFDAGLLGSWGGGEVTWWHAYIRGLLRQVTNIARESLKETDRG